MPSLKTLILVSAAAPMLFLAACDGYEAVEMTNMVPYTMERTTGKGVMYVRAAMMPAKGPVTAPVAPPMPEPEPVVQPAPQEADKVFTTKMGK